MERRYELESLRRSLVMLTPGVPALSREEALALLSELSVTQRRLDRLRSGLLSLLDLDGPSSEPEPAGSGGGAPPAS